MKKFFALLLTLSLALGAAGALAQAPDVEPAPPKEASPLEVQLAEEATRSEGVPQTQDKLTITDGVYTLETKGYTVIIDPPFGTLVLTQDMKSQVPDYLGVNNARGVLDFLMANDIGILFLDQATNTQVWLFIEPTKISQMFMDSDDDFETLLSTLKLLQQDASEVMVGERRWVRVTDSSNGADYVLYYIIKDGQRIVLQVRGEPLTEEMENYLVSIAESFSLGGQ